MVVEKFYVTVCKQLSDGVLMLDKQRDELILCLFDAEKNFILRDIS